MFSGEIIHVPRQNAKDFYFFFPRNTEQGNIFLGSWGLQLTQGEGRRAGIQKVFNVAENDANDAPARAVGGIVQRCLLTFNILR